MISGAVFPQFEVSVRPPRCHSFAQCSTLGRTISSLPLAPKCREVTRRSGCETRRLQHEQPRNRVEAYQSSKPGHDSKNDCIYQHWSHNLAPYTSSFAEAIRCTFQMDYLRGSMLVKCRTHISLTQWKLIRNMTLQTVCWQLRLCFVSLELCVLGHTSYC